jgi:hypothetical protein
MPEIKIWQVQLQNYLGQKLTGLLMFLGEALPTITPPNSYRSGKAVGRSASQTNSSVEPEI